MKKSNESGKILFSPTDLVRYLASPFASWMDRYHLEFPGRIKPDDETEDQKLIASSGDKHEADVLGKLESEFPGLTAISKDRDSEARISTLKAIESKAPIIYQARLELGEFAGYADFLFLSSEGTYQVWDSKLARAAKPYYAIQLCCYSEMLAALQGGKLPANFGIILGTHEKVQFRVEDYIHYYRTVKSAFLKMQGSFSGDLKHRPEPLPRADHGRWASHADAFFAEVDHLVRVAGITVGQMKKLKKAGIVTTTALANYSGNPIPKFAPESLQQLVSQARLQCQTRAAQSKSAEALPVFEILPHRGKNGEGAGLALLPPPDPGDVMFDMEGYPLAPGGLEYLFGACYFDGSAQLNFIDWWAHDRDEEKKAFEGFVDWVFKRWTENPKMHIYHYAPYEVSAMRRLSTRHDTRQDEIDTLLKNEVFVDLYHIVRQGLRVGTEDYSIKTIERLYRKKRTTEVATSIGSVVQYSRWIESGESKEWGDSPILKAIRDYNEDDCKSTADLLNWLRGLASSNSIPCLVPPEKLSPAAKPELTPEIQKRLDTCGQLRQQNDPMSIVLGDLIEFHRREAKPIWWRMFDRAKATEEELRDDPACIAGVRAIGSPFPEKQSLVQTYQFDPSQECKLAADDDSKVMFSHNLTAKFSLVMIDLQDGKLRLKISKKSLESKFGGSFPYAGSLLKDEFVSPAGIPDALADVAAKQISNKLAPPVQALLQRLPAASPIQRANENSTEAAVRVAMAISGGCFVCQGPPGTGKTYTASKVISALLQARKKVGVASNSHKAIENLLKECGKTMAGVPGGLRGIKVGGEGTGELFSQNPGLRYVEKNSDGLAAYSGGIVGGTAWLFTRPEWENALDFLFVDEAGQVSLANAVAMSRCAANIILLGDQMQLEQPVQGSHPGDAGLSVLQYALKDVTASLPDVPVFHPVVPTDYGLFLGETRRMHPLLCNFISDSIYEGRLHSHPSCENQKIIVPPTGAHYVKQEAGIVFSSIEHDGNTQQSDEEVERVVAIYHELLGRTYTDKAGNQSKLGLQDFLFISPYNAQVRALQAELPGAKVGSVDKFQGQEAPVCILSLCSSFGEYGSRGLAFILDRNRINVAISRAKCLAVVVADPRIAGTDAGSLEEMLLLNLFCKLATK